MTTACRCIKELEGLQLENPDAQAGVEIVRRALRTPAATIAKNAGSDPSIVVEKILTGEGVNFGYDALRDTYVDMISAGGCGCHAHTLGPIWQLLLQV